MQCLWLSRRIFTTKHSKDPLRDIKNEQRQRMTSIITSVIKSSIEIFYQLNTTDAAQPSTTTRRQVCKRFLTVFSGGLPDRFVTGNTQSISKLIFYNNATAWPLNIKTWPLTCLFCKCNTTSDPKCNPNVFIVLRCNKTMPFFSDILDFSSKKKSKNYSTYKCINIQLI